jgi:hypothetical protein
MSKQPAQLVFSKDFSQNLPWYRIWLMAITQPGSQTFAKLLTQTNVNRRRAYDWVFIGNLGFAFSILQIVGFLVEPIPRETGVSAQVPYLPNFCGQAFGLAIILLFGFIIIAALIHAVSSALGGKGTYEQLAYAFAAYLAPLGIITGLLSVVPLISYAMVLVAVYGFILSVAATRAVHQLSWGKAIVSNILVFVISLLFSVTLYQHKM